MSRIHEALKRAQIERSTSQDGGASSPVSETHSADSIVEASGAAAETLFNGDPTIAPPTLGGQLRFADLQARCAHPSWNHDPAMDVFANGQTSAGGAEQFRTLRSRLYQLRANQTLKVILVTSAVAAEGKTFVVSNIARAVIRQPDRRVLIIDADLRCSRLHAQMGAPAAPGLTDYLRGGASEFEVIQGGPEGNLWLIPGGNTASNASELLANGRLKTLLERIAPLFDWVFIDSPPCLPVADPSVIADLCNAVLLVVKAGSTPAATVQRAQHELQDKYIAGVVLNRVNANSLGYGSYYAYGSYGSETKDSSAPSHSAA